MRKMSHRLSLHRETLHRLDTVGPDKLARLRGMAAVESDSIPTWQLTEEPIVCLQTETTSD